MFLDFHKIGTRIDSSIGSLEITGDPITGGEGAGYQAKLNGKTVFYKEYFIKRIGNKDKDEVRKHLKQRLSWLVNQSGLALLKGINAPYGIVDDGNNLGYICDWLPAFEHLSAWSINEHPFADRIQVLNALATRVNQLHSRDVAHGDLHSNNIAVVDNCGTPEVFIFDMGNFNNGDPDLKPMMSGEVEHMPNWVREGGVQTKAADMFAFGVMAFELLLGKNIDSSADDVEQMFQYRSEGRIPGDPLRGTSEVGSAGMTFHMLSPKLQTLFRNMLAEDESCVPTMRQFLGVFLAEVEQNLIVCDSCAYPYFWSSKRKKCPHCQAHVPASVNVSIQSNGSQLHEMALKTNLALGRSDLGGGVYFSEQHLMLQPAFYGGCRAHILGRNGMIHRSAHHGRDKKLDQNEQINLEVGDSLILQDVEIKFARAA